MTNPGDAVLANRVILEAVTLPGNEPLLDVHSGQRWEGAAGGTAR